MIAVDAFESAACEPLGLHLSGPTSAPGFDKAECRRFEYTSRGDRVPGRLLLPEVRQAACPLVLLQHGRGGSKESPYLDAAAPWVRAGVAVATIDFPLHGERASAKLSERLTRTSPDDRVGHLLQIEFARQAVIDLRRAIDALGELPDVDASRVAYGGFSMGAMLGTLFCAVDPRPRGAALALGGGGLGPAEIDPCVWVGRIAPRPVLFINTHGDTTIPRTAADALHAAAAQPSQAEWFEGTHHQLPGAALKAMWQFLAARLDLD